MVPSLVRVSAGEEGDENGPSAKPSLAPRKRPPAAFFQSLANRPVWLIGAWLEGMSGQPNMSNLAPWSLARVEAGNQTGPI